MIYDFIMHNCMLDSGASHNLMPLSVMKQLNLQVIELYRDLYSFDSNKFKCLGVIKDMVVSLAQIPSRNLVMDVVVADISTRFGMLLSISWGAKLGGVLKLDFTHAIILVFGAGERRLYRETRFLKKITLSTVKKKAISLILCCMIMQNSLKIIRGSSLRHVLIWNCK